MLPAALAAATVTQPAASVAVAAASLAEPAAASPLKAPACGLRPIARRASRVEAGSRLLPPRCSTAPSR